MSDSAIRNPEQYEAARHKEALQRAKLIKSIRTNIVRVVDIHYNGRLMATARVEVIDTLIRFGALGANSKDLLRVARSRKSTHHQNIENIALTEVPVEFQNVYELVRDALHLLVTDGTLMSTSEPGYVVIHTADTPKPPAATSDLGHHYSQPDDRYAPLDWLSPAARQAVGPLELVAY